MTPSRNRWDARYADGDWDGSERPIELLDEAAPWLDGRGWALDLACGAGRNALALARMGYRVLAVDLSVEGLRRLRERARAEANLADRIHPVLADAGSFAVRPGSFHAVVDSYFLLRSSFPLLRRALAPGGVLVFETYHVSEIDELGGDVRREYALEQGELLGAFSGFGVLLHEEGVFQRPDGERGLGRLIARKR